MQRKGGKKVRRDTVGTAGTSATTEASALRLSGIGGSDGWSAMKRFKIMFKEIGWLWGLIFVINTALAVGVSPLYYLMYPVLITICIYFTIMRYDEEGRPKVE